MMKRDAKQKKILYMSSMSDIEEVCSNGWSGPCFHYLHRLNDLPSLNPEDTAQDNFGGSDHVYIRENESEYRKSSDVMESSRRPNRAQLNETLLFLCAIRNLEIVHLLSAQ